MEILSQILARNVRLVPDRAFIVAGAATQQHELRSERVVVVVVPERRQAVPAGGGMISRATARSTSAALPCSSA